MKKNFTNAAEELITGISAAGETVSKKEAAAEGEYLRYVEPRSERMNLLLSKSLVKKLEAEAKKRKMSKNGLVNDILENYFKNK